MEIVIDGSDSDDSDSDSALSRSPLLTRPEVFKRRTRRLKQLSKIYRDHYWSLMEDLKLKYRDYYWDYGKSLFLKDEDILHSLNRNHSNNYGTTIIPDDIQHPLNNDISTQTGSFIHIKPRENSNFSGFNPEKIQSNNPEKIQTNQTRETVKKAMLKLRE